MRTFIYKIYSYLIPLPLFIIVTIVVALLVCVAAMFGDTRFVSWWLPRLWSKFTCRICLHTVKVDGIDHLDPKQSYVFLANHQGYFDIFLMYGYLPNRFKWMMKEYLRRLPFVGLACAKSRQIFVGDSLASIKRAVIMATDTLKEGLSMCIFPEGTRTYDGEMIPFKRGAFLLARQIGLPIVPITINGSFDIFSRNDISVSQGTLHMTIHPPIMPEEYDKVPEKEFMNHVWNIIHNDLEKINK